MSDKYILRSGAIDAIKRNSGALYTAEAEFLLRKVSSLLKNAPAADVVEVVHGRWKKVRKSGSTWECSACGVKVGAFLAGCSQYCYCCGARMDMDGAAE